MKVPMLKSALKKVGMWAIASMLILGVCSPVLASKGPTITVDKKTTTSITIKLTSDKFNNEKADIQVKIKNKTTGKTELKLFRKSFSSSGKATVKLTELTPDTKYSFKVRTRKSSKKSYSIYSDSESAKTKS